MGDTKILTFVSPFYFLDKGTEVSRKDTPFCKEFSARGTALFAREPQQEAARGTALFAKQIYNVCKIKKYYF